MQLQHFTLRRTSRDLRAVPPFFAMPMDQAARLCRVALPRRNRDAFRYSTSRLGGMVGLGLDERCTDQLRYFVARAHNSLASHVNRIGLRHAWTPRSKALDPPCLGRDGFDGHLHQSLPGTPTPSLRRAHVPQVRIFLPFSQPYPFRVLSLCEPEAIHHIH